MTFVVPFDGSELAEAALVRATEFATVLDEDVLAVAVIPAGNARYAREKRWIEPGEGFQIEDAVSTLHEQVTDLCPSADFRHRVVDFYPSAGAIAKRVRKAAQDEDASMVFIGSDNAGRLVSSVSSVGATIATDDAYDVVIVRDRKPAKVAKIRDVSPHRTSKSEFYLVD